MMDISIVKINMVIGASLQNFPKEYEIMANRKTAV